MAYWEDLAVWYDQKQGETGDLWHRALIDPPLIKLIGKVKGKKILDLGCGNGYLARRFAREGGSFVVAVDMNPRIIELAKKRDARGVEYFVADASNLNFLKSKSFDIIYANMTLMDFENAKDAIDEVGRLLKRSGRFVASLSHPCFDNDKPYSDWSKEGEYMFRKIRRYREPFDTLVYWQVGDAKEQKPTRTFHRPLSWYAKALKDAGLVITELIEPGPAEEFIQKDKQAQMILDVPLHLVIEAMPKQR